MEDGRIVTRQLAQQARREQIETLQRVTGRDRFVLAAEIFEQMLSIEHSPEFPTLVAYNYID